jgi:hypothetical protein
MFLVANLDKNPDRGKSRVSSQTVPVDIKKLIHRRGGWRIVYDLVSLLL